MPGYWAPCPGKTYAFIGYVLFWWIENEYQGGENKQFS
jgi:hypothetical protein